MRLPKILVTSLGGTWCMEKKIVNGQEIKVPQTLGLSFSFAEQFPDVLKFCKPDFFELAALDSSNMTPEHWELLVKFLESKWESYDGFVILMGTDTMAFAASAVSFAIQNSNKPVVFSGAQLELDALGSDARTNVVNAMRVACLKNRIDQSTTAVRGVVVVFGTRIILGTRTRKYSEWDIEAFRSVNAPDVGRIRLDISLDPNMTETFLHKSERRQTPVFGSRFDRKVSLLYLYPGISPDVVYHVGRLSSGLILACFGAGNIPSSARSFENSCSLEVPIRELIAGGVPVGVTTQCVVGQAEMGMYETGSAARKAGAIILNDMTLESAFVKLSWILANESQWPKAALRAKRGGPGRIVAIRNAMITDYCGEITENYLVGGNS
jgi:L-asparaginase